MIVVFPQLLQLLTLIMFDAVKHRINLSRLCLRLIIAIAQRTAIHADQFDDTETDENLSYHLEDERQNEKADGADSTGD